MTKEGGGGGAREQWGRGGGAGVRTEPPQLLTEQKRTWVPFLTLAPPLDFRFCDTMDTMVIRRVWERISVTRRGEHLSTVPAPRSSGIWIEQVEKHKVIIVKL